MDTTPKKEHIRLFREAIKVLISKGYSEIKKVPLRKYPKSRHVEIYESKFAMLDASRVFQVSSAPEIVQKEVLTTDLIRSLYYCFFLNQVKPKEDFIEILGRNLFADFCNYEFIVKKGKGLQSVFRFVPDERQLYITSAFDRNLPNFTYLSYDSFIFKKLVSEKVSVGSRAVSILDYCCGVGYAGFGIKRDDDSLLGVDINPYAVWNAKLNSILCSHKNTDFICEEKVPKDRYFDIIVCNPPYVFMLPNESNKSDSNGGKYGIELTLKFLINFNDCLKLDGYCFILTSSPIIFGEDYLFKILNERYSHLCGEYFDLSDSLSEPARWEKRLGIEGYKYILLKILKESNKTKSGWVSHISKGDERFRYAF